MHRCVRRGPLRRREGAGRHCSVAAGRQRGAGRRNPVGCRAGGTRRLLQRAGGATRHVVGGADTRGLQGGVGGRLERPAHREIVAAGRGLRVVAEWRRDDDVGDGGGEHGRGRRALTRNRAAQPPPLQQQPPPSSSPAAAVAGGPDAIAWARLCAPRARWECQQLQHAGILAFTLAGHGACTDALWDPSQETVPR